LGAGVLKTEVLSSCVWPE
jgi:hypothetical protein